MIVKAPVPIRVSLMPKGNSRPGRKLRKLIGATIHNTGNYSIGANAEMHRRYQHGSGAYNFTSYHYVVDDKEIIQLVPEDEVAYHAGDGYSGRGNNETIAIEICVNKDGDIKKATANAEWLTADILYRHKLAENGLIFQHYDFTKKDCPYELRRNNPYSFGTFVDRVNNILFPKVVASPVAPNEPLVPVRVPNKTVVKRVPKTIYEEVTVTQKPYMKLNKDCYMWQFDVTSWNDFDDSRKVKDSDGKPKLYPKNTEILMADEVKNRLGSTYGRSIFSSQNKIMNGFNKADYDVIYK